jgi:hypothetical protein
MKSECSWPNIATIVISFAFHSFFCSTFYAKTHQVVVQYVMQLTGGAELHVTSAGIGQGPLTKGRITQQLASESGEGINFETNIFRGIQTGSTKIKIG